MRVDQCARLCAFFALCIQPIVAGGAPDSEGVRAALARARHQAEAWSAGYRIENAENRITAEFDSSGMTATHPRGKFALQLERYGVGERLCIPEPASLYARGAVVEYRRGGLTEWYRNESRGLEQGFTLRERPGRSGAGALTLELKISGDLRPVEDGGGVRLVADGGAVLRYTGIRAWDANGVDLPARMEVKGQRVRLLVSEAGARYPVTVDPWIEQQELTAPDGTAQDYFGNAVSISGNTAVVGAMHKQVGGNVQQGAVYVFVRSGGSWSLQQELTAADGAAYDHFGSSVAVSGDTIVVGAPSQQNSSGGGFGAAYVFVNVNGGWTQQQELRSADGQHQNFGTSVSVSGDTAVVGAYLAPQLSATPNQGAAYVFVRNAGTWTQQQMFTSEGAEDDRFGTSVWVSGDTAIVGAFQKKVGSNANQGEAYIFVRSGGAWTLQQGLTAPDGAATDNFGFSVSLSGDTALIGAWAKTVGANNSQGAAYVFVRSGSTWSEQQRLTASDGESLDNFGRSVAVNLNTAVVAAPFKQVGANANQGKAYAFVRKQGVWTEQQSLVAAEGTADDFSGIFSVGVSASTAVIGTPYKQIGSNSNQGAAFVFFTTTPGLASDFDTNGVPDLVWQSEGTRQVVVDYYGGGAGTTLLGYSYLYPGLGAAGWHVAAVADFNSDGYPDIVWQNDSTRQVTVHYYGGAGGASDLGWNWLYSGSGGAGWHVVAAADFNGDGVPDLVWQSDTTRQVVVHYYSGPGGATDTGWTWLYAGSGGAGWHVAAAADFNGDGVPDLVWQNDSTGQVVLHYYGGAGGATDLGWTYLYTNTVQGWHVAKAADFNGDGVPDLVWENNATGQTTVHYYGGPGGSTDLGWNWLFTGNAAGWSIK